MQPQLFAIQLNPNDAVYTPEWAARDMVDFFKPSGRILEPCKGDGIFLKYLPPQTEWCEISEGKDFYAWTEPVDWIISNPPYSTFRDWLEHSFQVAADIVYLVPLKNVFSAYGFIEMVYKYGWIKHVRTYGTGSKLNFPMGNAVGAIHFKRGYYGSTSWSFFTPPNKANCTELLTLPRQAAHI